ncbi:hypothetical protein [Micromonospora lupini]|uniref:Uncharacterized protein n=1 Tax=Micromonospora lupini str. Lupac 08 TaxID=1150864 RepID=I0KZ76_9ACTN|nr:hypothetical protein [Micromonospora lupini]CCH16873.1 hypothetical protein MILUP08_41790 [Micromonospora lupini str. Lupac 08]
MTRWILQVLATVGFGLLLGFIGLTMVFDLFGFVDAHTRRLSRTSLNRLLGFPDRDPAEVRRGVGYRFARFFVSGITLLLGVVAVVGGIVLLVGGPLD